MTPVELMQAIRDRGTSQITEDFNSFDKQFRTVLRLMPDEVSDVQDLEATLSHVYGYFTQKWSSLASNYIPGLTEMIATWSQSPKASINLLCIMGDLHYFIVWCFTSSSKEQCEFSVLPMRHLNNRFAKDVKSPWHRKTSLSERPKIVWLATYAESNGPISVTLLHCAGALLRGNCDLIVYAWREFDDPFLHNLRELGASCRTFTENAPSLYIQAIERALSVDVPEIIISDFNIAVPMAIFARRAAPAQIFLQAGPPAWPGPGLDAVFNSFGFDRDDAGWDTAIELPLDMPWNVPALIGTPAADDIVAERNRFPSHLRLIGNYGRLVKISVDFLETAEYILERCLDVAVIIGGVGDSSHIHEFLAKSRFKDRIFLEERYVSKHVWGNMLEIFLDTWPNTGAESAREMIAKCKPVVTLNNSEMPAILRQRDTALIANDLESYGNLVVELLSCATTYDDAKARAASIAMRMGDSALFTQAFNRDVRSVFEVTASHKNDFAAEPRRTNYVALSIIHAGRHFLNLCAHVWSRVIRRRHSSK